jgi:hypothetical protein
VKTRDSRLRWMVWSGGSSKMIEPGGISIPLRMTSSTVPLEEM